MSKIQIRNNRVSGECIAGPVRTCVICRKKELKTNLVRFVLDEKHGLTVDRYMRSPGRGWYCCRDPHCIARFAFYKPKMNGRSIKAKS